MSPGTPVLAGIAMSLAISATGAAADFSRYRGFHFGDDVAATVSQAGIRPNSVKVTQQRPELIQEAEWYGPAMPADPANPDPVSSGTLSFLDGKLYRIVVTYDRYRIEGLTVQEMIDAISLTYGEAGKPDVEIAYRTSYGDVAKVMARWQDADYACDLIRTGDGFSFALAIYDKRREALANTSIREASRLDRLDAPRRAIEEEKHRLEAERLATEKARAANKRNFRP